MAWLSRPSATSSGRRERSDALTSGHSPFLLWTFRQGREYIQGHCREFHQEDVVAGPAHENTVRAALDKASEEMLFIGPDHPYYSLLAELVSAVRESWQQGYEEGRYGGGHANPYMWTSPGG